MSADRVVIRPLTLADIPSLQALAADIWRAHYSAIIGAAQIEYMLEQRYDAKVLRAELAQADTWWDLLLVDDVPQGFASYFPDVRGDALKLDKLYVHASCQRLGLGARMLERALAKARALGARKLILAVNKGNASAIAAYRKWGFVIEEAVVKDIGGGFVMDDYVMARSL